MPPGPDPEEAGAVPASAVHRSIPPEPTQVADLMLTGPCRSDVCAPGTGSPICALTETPA